MDDLGENPLFSETSIWILFTYIIFPYPNRCWQEMKVALTMSEDGLNLTGTLDAQDGLLPRVLGILTGFVWLDLIRFDRIHALLHWCIKTYLYTHVHI